LKIDKRLNLKKLLISRTISEEVKRQLYDLGIEVYDISLLNIEPLKFGPIPHSDWIFFYSKNGIKYFINQLDEVMFNSIKYRKIGVMGDGSNSVLEKTFGKRAEFISSNNIEEEVKRFWDTVEIDHVLFIKSKNSRSSFEIVEKRDQSSSLITYQNTINKEIVIPNTNYVALTSPLSAEAYMNQIDFKNKIVFALGRSTQKYIKERDNKVEIILSKENSELSLLASIKDYLA
jgi:uroporphyrinogen-III synthase